MENSSILLQCYHRGCGQKYDPAENKEDSCRHHPGAPFFHDAYKGWSCCNKKCIDFTEFLNIKGCTVSEHSNEKLPEPEKPPSNVPDGEIIEVKPLVPSVLKRPPFETPMTTIKPEIAPSLQRTLDTTEEASTVSEPVTLDGIPVGTACKNGGCTISYQGPETNRSVCVHHPGVPIFHEGLKFWSCCQKRTTDFNAFLNQVGCERGEHVWTKEEENKETVQCRWDYHQTGGFVIVSIYAKQYCPKSSVIKLNPIRLYADLVFPQQSNATFKLDVELKGIIDVAASEVTMYGTKVEIKLKKAEIGSWSRLEIPQNTSQTVPDSNTTVEEITPQIEGVDLSEL